MHADLIIWGPLEDGDERQLAHLSVATLIALVASLMSIRAICAWARTKD
jgi:hypothetical protein